MNIKELKELIKDIPEDYIVDISVDEEGNRFGEVGAYEVCELLKGGKAIVFYPGDTFQAVARYTFQAVDEQY